MNIDIVFTIDKNYIKHFCVALTSLLENNNSQIGDIYLIKDFDHSPDLNIVLDFIKKKYNKSIICLELDTTILNNFRITLHITKATYFRLLLAEILPSRIEKIVFLDSDIVVNGDIQKIKHLNFTSVSKSEKDDSYYIYAADHKFGEEDISRLRKLGFNGNKYFNAGIMIINLNKWRENNISKKLIEYALRYEQDLIWWDQDVLNLAFDGNWGELDFEYNAFGLIQKDGVDYKIIHYTGSSKPWHFLNRHPNKNLYWKYLRKTPFYYSILYIYYLDILKRIPKAILNKIFNFNTEIQVS